MKTTLNNWNKLNLKWIEKIESIRDVILPYFLFLLPIKIPPKVLKDCSSSLTKFLWANKRCRINYLLLTRPPKFGGLSFPNLAKCNGAAQLKTIYSSKATEKSRKHIEQAYLATPHLREVIWNRHDERHKTLIANPF